MNELYFLLSPRGLARLGERRPEVPQLLTKLFKRGERTYPTADIKINTKQLGMYILPTVSDKSSGTILKGAQRSYQFLPTPRYKPVFAADANEILFTIGDSGRVELEAGQTVASKRQKELINDALDVINRSLGLTEEIQMSQLLTTGVISSTSFGDNDEVFEYEADFHYPSGHIVTLTDNELWTGEDVSPFKQEARIAKMIRDKTGMTIDVAVHGADAWEGFEENKTVKEHLHNRNIEAGSITDSAIDEYKGKVNKLRRFVYGGSYPDVFGNTHKVFEDDCVLYGCTKAPTFTHYGMPRNALNKTPIKRLYQRSLKSSGLKVDGESCPLTATDLRCFAMVRRVVK